MTPEGKIKKMVKELLKQHNVWYTMIIPSGYGASTGVPDFICIFKPKPEAVGIPFFIETKAPGKKPTPLQLKCMKDLEDHGAKCFVVDGEERLKEVEEWICQELCN